MLRPERMTFTSIICVRKDIESVLEALSSFGEFHIDLASEGNTSLTDYSQSIQKTEDSLINVNELTKQLCPEKPGLFDIFRLPKITKTQVTAENWQTLLESTIEQVLTLKKEVDVLNNSLSALQEKTAQLNHLKDMLTTIDSMGADLQVMEELKLIHITIASVPHKNLDGLKTALAGFPIILNRCYSAEVNDFVCLAMTSKHRSEIERILKIHHSDIFEIPQNLPHNAPEALKEVNKQIKENLHREKKILNELNKLGKKNNNKLVSWHEVTDNILTLLQAKSKILESGRLATVKGFVSQKKFNALTKKIHGMLGEKVLVLENETSEVEDPPTKFSHSRFISPFEELTKLYGVPHYEEVDPTPFMALTFPLIFGLMFGDVGHGLILLVGGLTLGILIKKNQAIRNMCWILAACGVGAIVAGALYGEFFGTELFHPLWLNPFNPINNVFMFLIFSLFIGIMQIMSGLALEMVNFLFRRNFADAVLTSLPKMAFYAGAVTLVAVYQLNFAAWFNGPILLVIVPFVVMVFAKPTFSIMQNFSLRAVDSQNGKTSFGQRLFESGDLVTRLLSNTISYTRILALLMAHWALILVTYTVAGLVGTASLLGLIISGVVIVGGNIFVLALEGLIVFIHTIRLHFYEWFSKFYQGNGTEFKAFKQNYVYTEVVPHQKKS
ncbi:MAG: V-type ATPase 116kDa subunit family protein [Candidatus Bathyarchaeia archaeon]|jgi:V/A-type H+-transporting ATPase subunit I